LFRIIPYKADIVSNRQHKIGDVNLNTLYSTSTTGNTRKNFKEKRKPEETIERVSLEQSK